MCLFKRSLIKRWSWIKQQLKLYVRMMKESWCRQPFVDISFWRLPLIQRRIDTYIMHTKDMFSFVLCNLNVLNCCSQAVWNTLFLYLFTCIMHKIDAIVWEYLVGNFGCYFRAVVRFHQKCTECLPTWKELFVVYTYSRSDKYDRTKQCTASIYYPYLHAIK